MGLDAGLDCTDLLRDCISSCCSWKNSDNLSRCLLSQGVSPTRICCNCCLALPTMSAYWSCLRSTVVVDCCNACCYGGSCLQADIGICFAAGAFLAEFAPGSSGRTEVPVDCLAGALLANSCRTFSYILLAVRKLWFWLYCC